MINDEPDIKYAYKCVAVKCHRGETTKTLDTSFIVTVFQYSIYESRDQHFGIRKIRFMTSHDSRNKITESILQSNDSM